MFLLVGGRVRFCTGDRLIYFSVVQKMSVTATEVSRIHRLGTLPVAWKGGGAERRGGVTVTKISDN
jgi:hypothetical protein